MCPANIAKCSYTAHLKAKTIIQLLSPVTTGTYQQYLGSIFGVVCLPCLGVHTFLVTKINLICQSKTISGWYILPKKKFINIVEHGREFTFLLFFYHSGNQVSIQSYIWIHVSK